MVEDNVASSEVWMQGTDRAGAVGLSVLHDYIRALSAYCVCPQLVFMLKLL